MKKILFKKIIALALSLCLVFTMIPMSALNVAAQESPIATTSGAWSTGAKNFGINKVYSTGLVACGAILKNIASATGNEEFEKLASFLNVWVFGGNPTTDILNEISKMCSQILTEVTAINEKMDIYSANILRQISETNFNNLENQRTTAWENDVVNVLEKYNIRNAFDSYFNFEALNTKLQTSEEEMSYLIACVYYQNGITDKNGKTYTQDDVKAYQDRLFSKFCEIHGNIDNSLSREEKKRLLFETMPVSGVTMDTTMLNAIKELSGNLAKINSDSYVDKCAQIAYAGLPNLAEQKDYVISNLNKQVLSITLTEMMYQEYLSMRGEYLEKNYDESDPLWSDYYKDVYGEQGSMEDSFKSVNKTVKNDIENRLSIPIKLSSGISLAIGQYPGSADLQGVMLNNTTFTSTFNTYDKEEPIIDFDGGYTYTDISSHHSVTSQFMAFDKLPVYTSNGVEMYYIWADEEFSKNNGTPKLVHGEFYVGNDEFLPSCDYFNLVRGIYTDGVNNFASPSLPREEAALFSTNSYSLSGSKPVNYLYSYYKDYTDKALYQIFSTYDYTQNGAFRDPHANFAVLDMTAIAPSLDLSFSEQQKISAQDSYEGYDNFSDGYYYTVILKNNSTDMSFKGATPTLLENKLSYSTTGKYTADIKVVKASDSSAVANTSDVVCGEPLTLKFKAVNNNTEFVSLKLLRYNNAEKDSKVTSEELILDADDFESLRQEDGYYLIDVNMPYSNAEFVIETKHKINTDEDENFIIKSYDDLLIMCEKVNSGEESFVNGNYIVLNDIIVPDGAQWPASIGTSSSKFAGSFDGQGYSISGLNSSVGGLFGEVYGATIKNIHLKNISYNCYEINCAGLCNIADGNSLISDCSVDGYISVHTTAIDSEPSYVAGICNRLKSGTIEKCISKTAIDADAYNVSGICCENNGTIKNCANFGNIKCLEINVSYDERIGANISGIVVRNNGSVSNCYNTAQVTQETNNRTAKKASIVTTGNAPVNSYYLNTCTSDSNATSKTIEQFNSGEVTYLLNSNVGISEWSWFQNIDNGKAMDEYPTLTFTRDNVVFKVNREDKTYSNIPNDYLLGDADLNGEITIMDATLIQLHCAQRYELTGVALVNADTLKDNIISISDATIIQAYIARVIVEL